MSNGDRVCKTAPATAGLLIVLISHPKGENTVAAAETPRTQAEEPRNKVIQWSGKVNMEQLKTYVFSLKNCIIYVIKVSQQEQKLQSSN